MSKAKNCDVLVIGGGGVGSSIAFWLKQRSKDTNVVVLEKDPAYKQASTVLSVGGLRQQFSLPENIQLSLFGAEFMKNYKQYLGDDVNLNFSPNGYLILASEAGAEQLTKNSKLQNELGAKNELLVADKLKAKFPWLNTDGLALGCYGLEKEGWFDPWALLMGFKNKAKESGAHFLNGEVDGFGFDDNECIEKVFYRLPNGDRQDIKFKKCIIASGAKSGDIGRMARIGRGTGKLRIPIPVEPRKRYVFVFTTQGQNCPGLATPLTVDPDGTYFRRDGLGGNFLAGRSPCENDEPCCDNLDVDYDYFDTNVWPTLANRIPAFESVKCNHSWAGYYEHNTFDANEFGHGIQQTPAVGRAISELILDGQFKTIDLTRLGFDRIIDGKPLMEANIV
uniref:FAD-dependent oxidoreductase domain-containing protein 1 n=1 Tax=Megaselia scalaris TaxID=36166 RepID=T1H350_MEGSC